MSCAKVVANLASSSCSNTSPLKRKLIDMETVKTQVKPSRRASSKYRGVCWLKERKAWRARIEIGGKREHLGYFNSEEEAALAYDKRARTVSRKKSRLNFPERPSDLDVSSEFKKPSMPSQAAKTPKVEQNNAETQSHLGYTVPEVVHSLDLLRSVSNVNDQSYGMLPQMDSSFSLINFWQQMQFMQMQNAACRPTVDVSKYSDLLLSPCFNANSLLYSTLLGLDDSNLRTMQQQKLSALSPLMFSQV